jgi:hypothetical protein
MNNQLCFNQIRIDDFEIRKQEIEEMKERIYETMNQEEDDRQLKLLGE